MNFLKIISMLFITALLTSCSLPNEVDVKNPGNLSDYIAIVLGPAGPGHERIDDVFMVSNNKAVKYPKNESKNMLNYSYDKYNKKAYVAGHVDCTIKTYDKNLNSNQYDICTLKNAPASENGFVTSMYITKDYILVYLNGGFTEKGYDNIIRVVDKDFNFVQDIKTNDLVLGYVMINNDIYYSSGKANDYQNEKIIKHNIKTNKSEIYFDNEEKLSNISLLVSEGKLYITSTNKNYKHDISIYKNKKLYTLKSNTEYIMDTSTDSITYVLDIDDGIDKNKDLVQDNKHGFITIKNNKIKISPVKCSSSFAYITEKNFYCDLENGYIQVTDLKTDKTKKVKLPFPSADRATRLFFFD